MIASTNKPESWQAQLKNAIRSPDELAAYLGLPDGALSHSPEAAADFPLLVPRAFAARMEGGNPDDPLLRQVLVSPEETLPRAGYNGDPLGERSLQSDSRGLLQKYQGRALLIATGHCAVNCRYCFRREFPYAENRLSQATRLQQVQHLLRDEGLKELILSGGDPLLLSDAQLAEIAALLKAAPHRVTLRVHTRLPIVIPERVTAGLLESLTGSGMRSVVVLHCNHSKEIDASVCRALKHLRDAGITVLNQAVLLKGVNDNATVLAQLSDALFDAGVLPYYLHLLDPVAGAAHFEVSAERARRIVGELAAQRPGYLVPKLAVEVPGACSKQELAPIYPTGDPAGDQPVSPPPSPPPSAPRCPPSRKHL